MGCVKASTMLLHVQRIGNEHFKDQAYPVGTAPLVSIALLETETAELLGEDMIDDFNKNVLRNVGRKHPKKGFFSSDTLFYLDNYEDFIEVRSRFPRSYKRRIESSLKSSMFYPYKWHLRPSFCKRGFLREIEWCTTRVFDDKKRPAAIIEYYSGLDNDILIKQEYPHVNYDD
jgi:hypothetical protein